MSFAHLHVHTEYSLLDGFSNIKKLVARAKEYNMPALAITDHGTMYGVIEFYHSAREQGIKPIIGLETYLAARTMKEHDPKEDRKSSHMLLLAENETGYKNLLKIASAAQLEGFYYFPRIDKEFLANHTEGLIGFSGCLSGEVPRLLEQGQVDAACRSLDWYYEIFGRENFFLELQKHDIPVLETVNRHLLELGKRYNARFVATNDSHYINPEDARLQDILLAIQTGSLLADPDRMQMDGADYYLRSPEEMGRLFAEVPESLSNTLLVAERCNVDLSVESYRLPNFDVPQGYTPETYLRTLCEEGRQRRYGERAGSQEVQKRLDYELEIIGNMGFESYFLIVWDLCRYARERGIWYNARGSAAGSIVAYTLDITLVDPLRHDLLFERFLNPGRIEMPDIDLDFRDDRRAEMLEYAVRKYGQDKVAQIITFGTLGARAALRDVGRVMDIQLSEVDRVAKLVPNIPGKPVTLAESIKTVPDLAAIYQSTDYLRDMMDTAAKMEGVVRNAGTHAAGVVISDRPLIEYLPLHRPTSNAEETPIKTVTQFEMGILLKLKLLKVDFLGLATLTTMARACDMIHQRHAVTYTLDNIPTDDPETFKFLGEGNTLGVFQVESTGMTRWLVQMKPQTLENVIAMVALYRPGPMDFIPDYISRMHGESPVEYRHPALEPIFSSTYGIPLYQEQLMRAAVELAGYSPAEADDLRSAISKKKAKEIEKHRSMFVKGAVKYGIERETAATIYSDWEEFARYGFNHSHAADYGVLAVQTAFLKLHYPTEYMTALLSVTKSETEKMALYVNDARSMGVEVLPPDINASEWDFVIEDRPAEQPPSTRMKSAIRIGLGAIKNVGQGAVEMIVQARAKGGAFKDLNDFAARVDLRSVGKRALECLIKVGAMDSFGSRAPMLETFERVVAISSSHFRAAEAGQLSLFGAVTGVSESIHLPLVPEADRREVLNWERELIGMYVSEHPLTPYVENIRKIVSHFSSTLGEAQHEERVRVAGMITGIRPHQTKTNKMMAWVTLEDLNGSIELVVFPRAWEQYQFELEVGGVIVAEGKVDARATPPKVLVDSIRTTISLPEPGQVPPQTAIPTANGASNRQAAPVKKDASSPQRVAEPAKYYKKVSHPSEERMENAESARGETPSHWEDEGPPPPEDPPEWDNYMPVDKPTFSVPDLAELPEEPTPASNPITASEQPTEKEPSPEVDQPATAAGFNTANRKSPTGRAPGVIIPPLNPAADLPPDHPPQMVTITVRPTGDADRDIRRIGRLHGTLISFPGRDRFQFQIFEDGKGHLIDFPNDTTRACAELLAIIREAVGDENISVEPITYQ